MSSYFSFLIYSFAFLFSGSAAGAAWVVASGFGVTAVAGLGVSGATGVGFGAAAGFGAAGASFLGGKFNSWIAPVGQTATHFS